MRVVGIGKVGQGECHWSSPQCDSKKAGRAAKIDVGPIISPISSRVAWRYHGIFHVKPDVPDRAFLRTFATVTRKHYEL